MFITFGSFVGVILVSLSDTNSNQAAGPTLRPTLQNTSINSRATLGDILALISAVFYAIYVILLKVRIKSESRIDMQLFFGFVGLFNIIACWPIGVVLHLSGIEVFELPQSREALSAIVINVSCLFLLRCLSISSDPC
jgi:solute carrier family 35 protein F5